MCALDILELIRISLDLVCEGELTTMSPMFVDTCEIQATLVALSVGERTLSMSGTFTPSTFFSFDTYLMIDGNVDTICVSCDKYGSCPISLSHPIRVTDAFKTYQRVTSRDLCILQ